MMKRLIHPLKHLPLHVGPHPFFDLFLSLMLMSSLYFIVVGGRVTAKKAEKKTSGADAGAAAKKVLAPVKDLRYADEDSAPLREKEGMSMCLSPPPLPPFSLSFPPPCPLSVFFPVGGLCSGNGFGCL